MVIGGTRLLGGNLRADFPMGWYGLMRAFLSAQARDGMVDDR